MKKEKPFTLKAAFLLFLAVLAAASCSVSKQIGKQAAAVLLKDSVVSTGHIGISIYDPEENKYLYNYNGEKYFVPASNTKLFSMYAGMKYLGDSLVGLRYFYSDDKDYRSRVLVLSPSGDPTFLHEDFKSQPVFDFLRTDPDTAAAFCIYDTVWKEKALGYGWSWDDYNEAYMAERSSFPVFGNVVNIELNSIAEREKFYSKIKSENQIPPSGIKFFKTNPYCFDSIINENLELETALRLYSGSLIDNNDLTLKTEIQRNRDDNRFFFSESKDAFTNTVIPFHTEPHNSIQKEFIASQFHKFPFTARSHYNDPAGGYILLNCAGCILRALKLKSFKIIHSQPTDSLLKPMMHNSDNFFAEQTLLMASNEKLGYMNDEAIIDMILNTDLKDVPQKPRWVDGSGLSRYNLFTPQDFIYILNKMKKEFGLERVKNILPTGGAGTLKNYYNSDSGFIYAKTGTLSNQAALSGYLITEKKKLLVFSVLVNNHDGAAWRVRRAVEKFLKGIRKKY